MHFVLKSFLLRVFWCRDVLVWGIWPNTITQNITKKVDKPTVTMFFVMNYTVCHFISFHKFTTLIIHNSPALSLLTQSLPFSQILPTTNLSLSPNWLHGLFDYWPFFLRVSSFCFQFLFLYYTNQQCQSNEGKFINLVQNFGGNPH